MAPVSRPASTSITACCLTNTVDTIISAAYSVTPQRHAGFRSPGVCHTAATAAMQPRMWTLGNTLVLVSME